MDLYDMDQEEDDYVTQNTSWQPGITNMGDDDEAADDEEEPL